MDRVCFCHVYIICLGSPCGSVLRGIESEGNTESAPTSAGGCRHFGHPHDLYD